MLRRRQQRRLGFSLLEMILATALVAGTLVPTTAVMRQAMQLSREATQRSLLSIYAVQLMENQAARAMRNWTSESSAGSFSADGYPSIRYTVNRSDDPGDGGLANRLMHIQAVVYDDANGDSTLTSGELRVAFRTKIAKLLSYENEPI